MPVYCKCQADGCAHDGPCGFTDCGGSIIHLYHGAGRMGGMRCPGWYEVDGQTFPTALAAWRYVRKARLAGEDPDWLKGMDARFAGKPRVADRYFKRWQQKYWHPETA